LDEKKGHSIWQRPSCGTAHTRLFELHAGSRGRATDTDSETNGDSKTNGDTDSCTHRHTEADSYSYAHGHTSTNSDAYSNSCRNPNSHAHSSTNANRSGGNVESGPRFHLHFSECDFYLERRQCHYVLSVGR